MDSKDKLYIERAENEVILARAIFSLSEGKAKKELFIPNDTTFYSNIKIHCFDLELIVWQCIWSVCDKY